MRITLLALLFVFFSHLPAFSLPLNSEGAAEALSVKFMTDLQNGDVSGAYLKMRPYMNISDDGFKESTAKSIERYGVIKQRFGKTVGYEFIGGKMVGTSVLRLQYLEQIEKYILRWSFYYYRTPSGWLLHTFTWDGDMKDYF